MNVLIISKEAWRDEQNGGNVLSNIFSGMSAEFAQIYCNECLPNNPLCHSYYRITDKEMLYSIIGRKKAGSVINTDNDQNYTAPVKESYSSLKGILGPYLAMFREIVWRIGKYDEDAVIDYAKKFNPDVIFAPCYGNFYMQRLTKIIHNVLPVPVISYISDDFYSNKQFQFRPSYWINHFLLRCSTRKVFKYYSLVYTMTDEQKEQVEKCFAVPVKILRKAGSFDHTWEKQKVNTPIRLVYAGSLYVNRWKTLMMLADAIREINGSEQKFILDIYTNSQVSEKLRIGLDDKVNSTIHPAVSSKELVDIYHQSDIALHVESFDLKYKLAVRMSFSTKIVDCLDSGCAVMAICDEKQAGYAYLKRNEAALCVSSKENIKDALNEIMRDASIIIKYQHKAFELGRKNHNEAATAEMISNDFHRISEHD